MRAIERTSRFKRESRGRHRRNLDKRLAVIVRALAGDEPLEPSHRDHALSGPWADFRDCHIRPDLVLIYEKPDFAAHAKAAISEIALAKAEWDQGTNNGAFNAFRADEHATKAILALYGLTPRVTHGVPQLAQQLRDARAGALDQEEREALARQIDELNGDYKELNAADYPGPLVEDMQATEHRLTRAAQLAARCVDLHARRVTAPSRKPTNPPDAHTRAVERIGRILHGSPKSLHNHPDRVDLDPMTNTAIESVFTEAAAPARAQVPRAGVDDAAAGMGGRAAGLPDALDDGERDGGVGERDRGSARPARRSRGP